MTRGPGAIGTRLITGACVTDELCECNHSIHQHFPTVEEATARPYAPQRCNICSCTRYRWSQFVLDNKKAPIASPPLDATC